MKKFAIASLLLATLGLSGQVSAIPVISFEPQPPARINPGQNFFLDVNISGLQSGGTNTLLGAFSLDVHYDPSLLQYLPMSSLMGSALGDIDAGEAIVGGTSGSGVFSFLELSLLEDSAATCIFCIGPYLEDLQGDSFKLATLAFYAPFDAIVSGPSTLFWMDNVVLSDALGNEILQVSSPAISVPVSEPSSFLLLGIGLIPLWLKKRSRSTSYFDKKKMGGNKVPRIPSLVFLAVVMFELFSTPAYAQLQWRFTTIAETSPLMEAGAQRPSTDRGNVAFTLRYGTSALTPEAGVYVAGNGSIRTVANRSTLVPGGHGNYFDSNLYSEPYLDNGKVAFVGRIGPTLAGVYYWNGNGLEVIADTETLIPGGAGLFKEISGGALDNGQVVFFGTGDSGQQGTYRSKGGSLDVIANTATLIPTSVVLPSQFITNFTGFYIFPSIDGDDVAFGGYGPPVGDIGERRGIYINAGGNLKVVADRLTPIPGHAQTDVFNFGRSPSLHKGKVAFKSNSGIYSGGSPNSLERVVEVNMPIPGGTGLFTSLGDFPSINHDNVAFSAGEGIYLSLAGTQRMPVKVFDATDSKYGVARGEFFLFHDALDGNSVAFVTAAPDALPNRVVHYIVRADLVGLSFSDFSNIDQLKLNGAAQKIGTALRLTPDEGGLAGSSFFPMPFTLGENTTFHTHFTFQIGGGDGEQDSDGLAFVIQNDPRGASALGNGGEGLGFGLNDTGGNPVGRITPSVAIEFDTHYNSFPLQSVRNEPDGNHVALIINGEVSNHQVSVSPGISLNNGASRFVWIDYVGVTKKLEVFLSTVNTKPATPIISTTLDLAAKLGKEAFFGFTAGTGAGFNSHDILAWNLNVESSPSLGDFNGDGCIDQSDLTAIVAVISGVGSKPLVYDLNGDGKVNIVDSRKLVTLFTNPKGAACLAPI